MGIYFRNVASRNNCVQRIQKEVHLMNQIKTEKSEDEEIKEMAAKITKENCLKMSTMKAPVQTDFNGRTLNFQKISKKPATFPIITKLPNSFNESAMDAESFRGHFGWTSIGCVLIPYILRGVEKYCCVRILETKLLDKYLNAFDKAIYTCIHIPSFYVTEAERRLLNEINFVHCNSQFGRESFTLKDLIVKLNDAEEFYDFLELCFQKLVKGNQGTLQKCGFIRINKENVVPYVTKNDKKHLPLFYFEGDLSSINNLGTVITGWDLSYLKFCCKIQGINETLYNVGSCIVVDFDCIKKCFPEGTLFEDHWPNSNTITDQLLVNEKSCNRTGQWTHQSSRSPCKLSEESKTPGTQAKFKVLQKYTATTTTTPTRNPKIARNIQVLHSNNGLQQMITSGAFPTNLISPTMNVVLTNGYLKNPNTIKKKQ